MFCCERGVNTVKSDGNWYTKEKKGLEVHYTECYNIKKYCRQKTPRMEYPRSLFAYKGIRRKRGYGVIEYNRHNRKWSRLGMANDYFAAWYTYLYDSQDRIYPAFYHYKRNQTVCGKTS